MSGSLFSDPSGLVNVIQETNKTLTALLNAFNNGSIVTQKPPVYTVASLPTTAASGQYAFASNGRKPAEGAGAGTGVPVFWNSGTGSWFSYCSGLVVTV